MKNNVLFLTTMNLNITTELYNIKSIKAVINHRQKHDEFAKLAQRAASRPLRSPAGKTSDRTLLFAGMKRDHMNANP